MNYGFSLPGSDPAPIALCTGLLCTPGVSYPCWGHRRGSSARGMGPPRRTGLSEQAVCSLRALGSLLCSLGLSSEQSLRTAGRDGACVLRDLPCVPLGEGDAKQTAVFYTLGRSGMLFPSRRHIISLGNNQHTSQLPTSGPPAGLVGCHCGLQGSLRRVGL